MKFFLPKYTIMKDLPKYLVLLCVSIIALISILICYFAYDTENMIVGLSCVFFIIIIPLAIILYEPHTMSLKDYAIKAFREGSDNYGESVTGTHNLYHNTMKAFAGQNQHYAMTVLLRQSDGHPCTSSIGFYEKNVSGKKVLQPCSGHLLPWTIDITSEIQSELDSAVKVDF